MLHVLYIGGVGRSGSTLLSRLLDAGDDAVALGELMRLRPEQDLCSCGEIATACPVWGSAWSDDPAACDLHPLAQAVNRKVLAPWVATGSTRLRDLSGRSGDAARYREALRQVLARTASVVGDRWLVDKSMSPYHLAVLAELPEVDLRVAHLVRDPRGFAHSVGRSAEETRGQPSFQAGPSWAGRHWLARHLLTEAVVRTRHLRSARVRYEDLARDPEEEITALRARLGLAPEPGFAEEDGAVQLDPPHLINANRMRFEQGSIQIRTDDAWQRRGPRPDHRALEVVTAPLAHRYGYRTLRA